MSIPSGLGRSGEPEYEPVPGSPTRPSLARPRSASPILSAAQVVENEKRDKTQDAYYAGLKALSDKDSPEAPSPKWYTSPLAFAMAEVKFYNAVLAHRKIVALETFKKVDELISDSMDFLLTVGPYEPALIDIPKEAEDAANQRLKSMRTLGETLEKGADYSLPLKSCPKQCLSTGTQVAMSTGVLNAGGRQRVDGYTFDRESFGAGPATKEDVMLVYNEVFLIDRLQSSKEGRDFLREHLDLSQFSIVNHIDRWTAINLIGSLALTLSGCGWMAVAAWNVGGGCSSESWVRGSEIKRCATGGLKGATLLKTRQGSPTRKRRG